MCCLVFDTISTHCTIKPIVPIVLGNKGSSPVFPYTKILILKCYTLKIWAFYSILQQLSRKQLCPLSTKGNTVGFSCQIFPKYTKQFGVHTQKFTASPQQRYAFDWGKGGGCGEPSSVPFHSSKSQSDMYGDGDGVSSWLTTFS